MASSIMTDTAPAVEARHAEPCPNTLREAPGGWLCPMRLQPLLMMSFPGASSYPHPGRKAACFGKLLEWMTHGFYRLGFTLTSLPRWLCGLWLVRCRFVSRAIRCRTRRTGSCSASPSCEPLLDWALSRQRWLAICILPKGFPPGVPGMLSPPVPLRRNEASWADNGVLMDEIAGRRAEEIAGVDKPQLDNEIVQTITCPPACAILTLLHADCCLLGSSNWGHAGQGPTRLRRRT